MDGPWGNTLVTRQGKNYPMRIAWRGIFVLAIAVVSSASATAHHSEAHDFDVTKAITLEGLILCVV